MNVIEAGRFPWVLAGNGIEEQSQVLGIKTDSATGRSFSLHTLTERYILRRGDTYQPHYDHDGNFEWGRRHKTTTLSLRSPLGFPLMELVEKTYPDEAYKPYFSLAMIVATPQYNPDRCIERFKNVIPLPDVKVYYDSYSGGVLSVHRDGWGVTGLSREKIISAGYFQLDQLPRRIRKRDFYETVTQFLEQAREAEDFEPRFEAATFDRKAEFSLEDSTVLRYIIRSDQWEKLVADGIKPKFFQRVWDSETFIEVVVIPEKRVFPNDQMIIKERDGMPHLYFKTPEGKIRAEGQVFILPILSEDRLLVELINRVKDSFHTSVIISRDEELPKQLVKVFGRLTEVAT
jgi:hypothetical protein